MFLQGGPSQVTNREAIPLTIKLFSEEQVQRVCSKHKKHDSFRHFGIKTIVLFGPRWETRTPGLMVPNNPEKLFLVVSNGF